jgi:hypothetical protein
LDVTIISEGGGLMLERITPSKISAWQGTPVEGSPFTVQQHRVMAAERPGWKTFADLPVKLSSQPHSLYDPAPPPVIARCPIIAWTKDRTRVLIIAPAGDKKWMDADLAFINGKGPRSANTPQT